MENIREAIIILRNELLKHGNLYEGFLASIESSVKEQKLQGLPFQPEREIAEKILKRIIGGGVKSVFLQNIHDLHKHNHDPAPVCGRHKEQETAVNIGYR